MSKETELIQALQYIANRGCNYRGNCCSASGRSIGDFCSSCYARTRLEDIRKKHR